MPKPISPPPVIGSSRGELPAYLSNGVIGLRVRDNPLIAGMTLVSGLIGCHSVRKIEAAALAPYPLAMDLAVDGIWMSDAADAVQVIEQSYDFEVAQLTTRLRYKPADAGVELEVVTFCSRDEPTVICQRTRLRSDRAALIEVRPMIDTRGVDGVVLAEDRFTPGGDQSICDGWLHWETAGALSTCGIAFATRLVGHHQAGTCQPMQRGRFYTDYRFRVRAGRTYGVDQLASIVPRAMHSEPDLQAVRLLSIAVRQGLEAMRLANHKQWSDLWRSRIRIIGDDDRWQAIADAAYFYMMTSSHGSSPASTSIFGLATWGDYHYYYGHVMWDVETFAIPALTFFQPAAAEALLEYRFNHLNEARQNALMRGRRGLQFPWESGPSTGHEAAPLPGSSSWHEDHITPDVGRAFALFAAVTGKDEFRRHRAWPVLCGVAEWVASRTTPGPTGHQILDSMGIAEREQESDNPSFAIMAAQAALEDAVAMSRETGVTAPPEWSEIAAHLAIPMRRDVLVSHDGYRTNEEKGATPDPLMAIFPLWRELPEGVEKATLDFYLARAEGYIGSPMLSALYGVWAAWAGERALSAKLLDEGYAQFAKGRFDQILEYRPDRFPEQPQAGPFAANMGGFLMSLFLGFPGIRPTNDPPETWARRPVTLPQGWEAIQIDHLWIRGKSYRLEAVHGAERAILEPAGVRG